MRIFLGVAVFLGLALAGGVALAQSCVPNFGHQQFSHVVANKHAQHHNVQLQHKVDFANAHYVNGLCGNQFGLLGYGGGYGGCGGLNVYGGAYGAYGNYGSIAGAAYGYGAPVQGSFAGGNSVYLNDYLTARDFYIDPNALLRSHDRALSAAQDHANRALATFARFQAAFLPKGTANSQSDPMPAAARPVNGAASADVAQIISRNCTSCHNATDPSGGLDLTNLAMYSDQKASELEKKIMDRITTSNRAARMPKGGTLTTDEIATIFKASGICTTAKALPAAP